MKINVFNKEITYDKPLSLLDILNNENKNSTDYICAKVNKRLRELTYIIDKDCSIEFLDLSSRDSVNIYQSSLRYLFVMAVHELYKDAKVVFNYSISRSIFARIYNIGMLDKSMALAISNKINELIEKDIPIERTVVTKEEAEKIYGDLNLGFKTKLFKYRKESSINMYKCNNYYNYMYSYMVPSTKFLSKYKIALYSPGLIIQYPRAELGGEIPVFDDEMVFGRVLKESNKWGEITNSSVLYKLNQTIDNNGFRDLVALCEARHSDMLSEVANNIKSDIENIKLIAIAGPSSSGKTTLCNRLRIQLISKGIKPVMISIDDYYKEAKNAPKDEFGNPDLETVYALDLELFNDNMYRLIQGENVTLPKFDFSIGKRVIGQTIKLEPNQPIMIEGIHALNDILTPSIPTSQKYKIYVAPQSQLHIDEHNPISMSDIRLIRRIVRDLKYRNCPPSLTMTMWPSVRSGEFKWIYPYQQQANYVFNSELTYELAVMKKYAVDALNQIDEESEFYILANRILKFLKYIIDIDEKWVPCNSILREFIGGSIFYDN